jgi:hypothetical protein
LQVSISEAMTAPHVADKIVNHSSGTIKGVAAIYNKAAYLEEREAAMSALGRFVEALVRPASTPGNVVASCNNRQQRKTLAGIASRYRRS